MDNTGFSTFAICEKGGQRTWIGIKGEIKGNVRVMLVNRNTYVVETLNFETLDQVRPMFCITRTVFI